MKQCRYMSQLFAMQFSVREAVEGYIQELKEEWKREHWQLLASLSPDSVIMQIQSIP